LRIGQTKGCERALLSGSQKGEILMHCFTGFAVWAGRVYKGHLDGPIGSAFGPLKDYARSDAAGHLQHERLQRTAEGGIGQAYD
jgi:hypothetical protein